jgi:hypothetical protein
MARPIKWGSSNGQKCAVGTTLISLGPALVANLFYRRGSQEKTFPHRWNFSCFQPHAIKLGVFWSAAPSARMLAVQQFRFSFSAVFIALRDEASPL